MTDYPDFSEYAAAPKRKAEPAAGGGKGRYSQTYTEEKIRALKERGPEARERPGSIKLPGWLEHAGGAFHELTSQPVLPILDEINAGARAAGDLALQARRLGAPGGGRLDLDRAKSIYLAQMDADKEIAEAKRKKYPVSTFAGGLLSSIPAAPEAIGAKLTATAATRVPGATAALMRYAGNVAKGSAGGAAYGAAYGAADAPAEGLGSRLEGAGEGAVGGAVLGGLLEGVAAPLIAPVAKRVLSKLRQRAQPAEERTAATAREVVTDLAEGAGIRSAADVTAKATGKGKQDFRGQRVIAAELAGKPGEAMLRNVSLRKGKSGDAATLMAIGREQTRPGEIKASARDTLGVDPDAAEGDVIKMIEAGEKRARPKFDEALNVPEGENAPGIWTDELGGMARRPVVREAMNRAALEEQNFGRSPEGLTWGDVEVPPDTPLPDWAGLDEAAGPKGQGAVTGGTPLLQFVGREGGLAGGFKGADLGELLAMDADKWHIGKPFMNRLIGPRADKAHTLEQMAEKAFDAGFFPDRVGQGPPSPEEFLEIIREEMRAGSADDRTARGTRFARGGEAVERRGSTMQPPEERAYYGDTPADELPSPEQYDGGFPPPEREPALMQAPTARSWDNVRRELNRLAGWEHSSSALERAKAPAARQAVIDLTNILTGKDGPAGVVGHESGERLPAIPMLKEALEESGDYIRIRETYRDFGGRLFEDGPTFKMAWDKLDGGSRKAAQAAMMRDINKLWGAGKLKGGKFDTPNVRANLREAFGPEAADDFIGQMEVQARLSESNKRFMVDSGSQTAKNLMAAGDMPAAAGGVNWAEAGNLMLAAPKNPAGVGLGIMARLGKAGAGAAARARTVELPEAARDEIGRILMMGPEEFGRWLETKPREQRASWQAIRAKAVAAFAGGQQRDEMEEEPAY